MLLQYLPTDHGQPPDNLAFSQEPMLNPTLPQKTLPPQKKKILQPQTRPTLTSSYRKWSFSSNSTHSSRTELWLQFFSRKSTTRSREPCHSHLCFIHLYSVSGSFTEAQSPTPQTKQQWQEKPPFNRKKHRAGAGSYEQDPWLGGGRLGGEIRQTHNRQTHNPLGGGN